MLYLKHHVYKTLELKRIYRIFEFGFDSEFVRRLIEIRNIEIPG